MKKMIRKLFSLDDNITYLNHGSFGACPQPIFDALIDRQKQLEQHPVQFLDVDAQKLMITSIKTKNLYQNFEHLSLIEIVL